MHENFISAINRRNEPADEIAKVSSLINQMKLIDENVKDLFINCDEESINDHDSFLLFRGKVAKRLVDYTSLIFRCQKIIGCNRMPKEVKNELNYHSKNLENQKRELSLWWKNHEKKYHQLCLKIFLKEKESVADSDKNEDPEKAAIQLNLEDTKKMMLDEVNRMRNVKSELIKSSDKLKKQDETFNSFETKIKSSAQLVLSLKKKAESDTKYVWFSFFFFLTVCVYIILRRLGFIRAVITIIKLTLSALLYLIKSMLHLIIFFKKNTLPERKTVEVTKVGNSLSTHSLNTIIQENEL